MERGSMILLLPVPGGNSTLPFDSDKSETYHAPVSIPSQGPCRGKCGGTLPLMLES